MGLAADAADLFEECFVTRNGQNGTQKQPTHPEPFPDRSKSQTRASQRLVPYVYGMARMKCCLSVFLMTVESHVFLCCASWFLVCVAYV